MAPTVTGHKSNGVCWTCCNYCAAVLPCCRIL